MLGEVVMSLKNELKRDVRNIMKDVGLEADKIWSATYEGHTISVKNTVKEESLLVDDVMIAQNRRTSFWSYLVPYVTLKGSFQTEAGQVKKVSAKIGGFMKFNCTIKVDGQNILAMSEKFEYLPWKHKETIMHAIQEQLQAHGKLVTDVLPDDPYVYDEHHPKIEPGLADQSAGYIDMPVFVKKKIKLIAQQINNPTDQTRAKTYEEITSEMVASYAHTFIELFERSEWDEQAVQREAIWLLEHGAHREVVKFALLLLGCTSCDAYRSLILEIGQHEEFTSFAAFALEKGCTDAEASVFTLAQTVDGWGRVYAIESLQGASEEIRHWLLTEGYQNRVAVGYSAVDCVNKGRLVDVLAAEVLSKEQYEHANVLLQSILNPTVSGVSIESVDQLGLVLTRFFKHAEHHCTSLSEFYTITLIADFLEEDEGMIDWNELYEEGDLTEEARVALQETAHRLTDDRKWLATAVDRLETVFDQEAYGVATFYGLHVAAKLFMHLKEAPTHVAIYEAIMSSEVQQDAETLCNMATQTFDFDRLTTEDEACLRVILEHGYLYEVMGLPLIERVLTSSNPRMQEEALTVLTYWERSDWEGEQLKTIIQTIGKETEDKELRRLARSLLK